jgi:anaerobic ribonucleoside-triphosphate reductase activating protein
VDELAEKVLSVVGIEGVTFVGGEPFAQAQALAKLSKKIHAAGLSVMTYSGFTYEELQQGCIVYAIELLAETDLLLDGRYEQGLLTERPWRGSDNQQLIALSERYAKQIETWNQPTGQQFEIHIGENGKLEVLGIPPIELAIAQARHPSVNTDFWRV